MPRPSRHPSRRNPAGALTALHRELSGNSSQPMPTANFHPDYANPVQPRFDDEEEEREEQTVGKTPGPNNMPSMT